MYAELPKKAFTTGDKIYLVVSTETLILLTRGYRRILFKQSYLNPGGDLRYEVNVSVASDLMLFYSCPRQSLELLSLLFPLSINSNYFLRKLQTFVLVIFF